MIDCSWLQSARPLRPCTGCRRPNARKEQADMVSASRLRLGRPQSEETVQTLTLSVLPGATGACKLPSMASGDCQECLGASEKGVGPPGDMVENCVGRLKV